MKRGNQFYLDVEVYDKNDELIDINIVKKIQFNLDTITKIYDGENTDVTYDNENKYFKIYLTEDETFNFKDNIKIDARVLDKNDLIFGSLILTQPVHDAVNEEKLDVETESN